MICNKLNELDIYLEYLSQIEESHLDIPAHAIYLPHIFPLH